VDMAERVAGEAIERLAAYVPVRTAA
jgi:hypothetical protein